MKSKLSLKNLAKRGLLVSLSFLILSLICGCPSSVAPTYLKEEIEEAIQNICKNEYKIDVKVKRVGETLWTYLPLQDLLVKSDRPEKYIEKFTIEENKGEFLEGIFKVNYKIKTIPEEEKFQEYTYSKSAQEKINNVWKVLRRVLFSMERSKQGEPKFLCLVSADIKNGFEIKDITYYLDLKKVSYGFISWGEYQHRSVSQTEISANIIGDTEGKHLNYKDITMEEFIARQIQHRIKLKFQKPEVDRNADIDREILKTAIDTIKIYKFGNFSDLELYNLITENRIILNRKAVLAGITE